MTMSVSRMIGLVFAAAGFGLLYMSKKSMNDPELAALYIYGALACAFIFFVFLMAGKVYRAVKFPGGPEDPAQALSVRNLSTNKFSIILFIIILLWFGYQQYKQMQFLAQINSLPLPSAATN